MTETHTHTHTHARTHTHTLHTTHHTHTTHTHTHRVHTYAGTCVDSNFCQTSTLIWADTTHTKKPKKTVEEMGNQGSETNLTGKINKITNLLSHTKKAYL